MSKFLAVVKREYIQRVRAKMFIVTTVLLPVVMSLFGIVPVVILNIDAGSMWARRLIDRMVEKETPARAPIPIRPAEKSAA